MAELRYGKVADQEKENKSIEGELGRFAGGQARLTALAEEQARREAEQIRAAAEQAHQAEQARVAAKNAQVEQERLDRLASDRAQEASAKLAQAAQDRRMQERAIEQAQIERISAEIIPQNNRSDSFYSVLTKAAAERGIVVESPATGHFILSVKGSEHKFEHQDLVVNGQSWADAVNTQRAINYKALDDFNREREVGNDRGR